MPEQPDPIAALLAHLAETLARLTAGELSAVWTIEYQVGSHDR
jgi:hypothetical protein